MAREGRQNITFSLPKEVIQKAKLAAVKRGTSVNSLVEEYLNGLSDRDDSRESALQKFLDLVHERPRRSTGKKLKREDLYDRKVLLRH